ncbi:MAG: UDP-N-acetylglucosamine 1-carboxyvinyltransferase [Nitrospina sp.]|jgi:UDP-N-acetylglucosamine 1-carboxyvinyltransferase|nr:UDP-N-acetylglucosamine 1-carboxyvinyltransferase [Nitrospina sp.]MBT6718463.1 UDP-N-acetylglucosamine 1-carboxyvinyltransferase [Nitrospina sp.]
MDKIVIEGGKPLEGTVKMSGAKNAVLPVLAATLLTRGRNIIEGVPKVRDVATMIKLLEDLGAQVESYRNEKIILDTSKADNPEAPYDLVSTMRASCLVLGPLLARLGKARVSLPGGCAIGARPIDLHIKGLEAMGAKISLEQGYVHGKADRLKGIQFFFDTVSVTGTANLMMAAVLAEGETVLENAAKEPEVVFLADILNRAGAKISGHGTDIITIQGTTSLNPIECTIFPDRIETGTFMIAAAITQGDVTIENCMPQHVEPVTLKLQEAQVDVELGENKIRVKGKGPIDSVNARTHPYPGFPTDIQAQFMALMTLAQGQSIIMETVFENRFMHVAELKRMGADISLDGHTAIINGVKSLSGAPLMATDLRASASLVLAALAAKGQSIISRVYHIDRGYVGIEKKLMNLGAQIRRIK